MRNLLLATVVLCALAIILTGCNNLAPTPSTSGGSSAPAASKTHTDKVPHACDLVTQADAAVHDYVGVLRGRGISWTRIGEALGVSKQAAWERFSGED